VSAADSTFPKPPILEIPVAFKLGLSGQEPFLRVRKRFALERPGIYSLEGPNGSGKSMLVRLLTGCLPTVFDRVDVPVLIDHKQVDLESCRDALAAGIVAVFQDDGLISSMTVYEQVLLRHSRTNITDFGAYAWDLTYHDLFQSFKIFGASIPDRLQRILDRLEPKHIDWRNRRAIRNQAIEFLRRHSIDEAILDEFPTVLSGGGRAAAKLVSVQLYENTRVLILDEALSGVERNIWPRYVDGIKQWAIEKQIAVLVISHAPEELDRWEPIKRFEIRDQQLIEDYRTTIGEIRRNAARARSRASRVFYIGAVQRESRLAIYGDMWRHIGAIDQVFTLIEPGLKLSEPWKEFQGSIPAGVRSVEYELAEGAELRGVNHYGELIEEIDVGSRDKRCALIVAGGENAMNWGSFVSETVAHRDVRTTLIPSTIDAMHFAATSAMASIRFPRRVQPSSTQKIVDGSEAVIASVLMHPRSTLLNQEFLKAQTGAEIRAGLVTCLRVGLLADKAVFEKSRRLLTSATIDYDTLFEVIKSCVSVVGEFVAIDSNFSGLLRVFSYGGVHADAINTMSGDKLGRGESLLLGMIAESLLCGSDAVQSSLVDLFKVSGFRMPTFVSNPTAEAIDDAYAKASGKFPILALALQEVGELDLNKTREMLSSKNRHSGDLSTYLKSRVSAEEREVDSFSVKIMYSRLRSMIPDLNVDSSSH
jgi:ABC-type branched-subunit amino acid transport system ATPase component